MKGKTQNTEQKEAPKGSKNIIKKVLDGKDVRKSGGGKVKYATGGPVSTAKGMGAAVKGGKYHEA
jgi:hypothetical protein